MKKQIFALAVAASVLAVHMPAAEAVYLGNIGNIGSSRTYNRSYSRTTTTNVLNQAINKAVKKVGNKNVVLQNLPQTAADVAVGTDAQKVAAYAVAALARYEQSPADAYAMLDTLLGPRPLNGADKQFIQDRFRGKAYLMRSYFKGATPKNNYTPSQPYTVEVQTNDYTYQQEGYARFLITCGGADSPRPMTLRKKGSTGEWFLWDYKGLLSGIRKFKRIPFSYLISGRIKTYYICSCVIHKT